MIALDNCQACRLAGRQDLDEMEGAKLLMQTQFGKRLILVSTIDEHELIPPEVDDEEYEEPGARGGPVATQKILDQEERRCIAQLERQEMGLCTEVEISSRRAENSRKA